MSFAEILFSSIFLVFIVTKTGVVKSEFWGSYYIISGIVPLPLSIMAFGLSEDILFGSVSISGIMCIFFWIINAIEVRWINGRNNSSMV